MDLGDKAKGELIDHQARAMHFHRRAQHAEAQRDRAAHNAADWMARWKQALKREATVRRKLTRTRAALRRARGQDPLTRIIELGKAFP